MGHQLQAAAADNRLHCDHGTSPIERPVTFSRVILGSFFGVRAHAVRARPVAAIAGLSQRIGAETGELLRRHELVYPAPLGGVVGVVHPLGALIAEPAELLKTDGARHRGETINECGGAEAPPHLKVLPERARSPLCVGWDRARPARERCLAWSTPGGPAAAYRPATSRVPLHGSRSWTTSFLWWHQASARSAAGWDLWPR